MLSSSWAHQEATLLPLLQGRLDARVTVHVPHGQGGLGLALVAAQHRGGEVRTAFEAGEARPAATCGGVFYHPSARGPW